MPWNERKRRRCLKCGKQFPSDGPGNRICWKCTQDNNHYVVRGPVIVPADNSARVAG